MDLKIRDVAELLNVSETTIRRWLSDGKIPAYRIHHQYRFSRLEIENWVLSHKMGKHSSHDSPFQNPAVNHPQSANGTPHQLTGGNKQFSLFRAIYRGGVLKNVPGNTKEEVIRTAMEMIAADMDLDADVISDLLLDRERLQSTALNNGIAIPHTRDFLLDTHIDMVPVVFPEKALPYDALDGNPVHTLFFLFASDDKRHLHLLAKIAHLSSQPAALELLNRKPSKEALLDYVKEWESTIHANIA